MCVGDTDLALAEVFDRREDADPRAVIALVESDDPEVENVLLEKLAEPLVRVDLRRLLCRILVERDPARDPRFLLGHLLGASHMNPFKPKPDGLREDGFSNPFPGSHFYGFSRLLQLYPVNVYARQLNHRWRTIRLSAATALGDTADLLALEPLAVALGDRSWRVRMCAADSVRRLRHAGASNVLASHPVRDGLIRCLSDGHHKVRVAAARALGSMGDLDPIRERRERSWRSRPELDRVLRGEIPPLPKIWPCDDTV